MYQNGPFCRAIKKDVSLGRTLEAPRMKELCFISEYLYQSIIFEAVYPELSRLYERLAMDKMEHYKALSALQYDLGVNPTVNLKLSTKAINIDEDRDSIAPRAALRSLRGYVRAELASADEYRRIAEMSPDGAVSNLLICIADTEDEHARLLTSFECNITTN